MTIEPIAYFHSPFTGKFGVPKQSGLVTTLEGTIEFVPAFRNVDVLRGLDEFDYIWLIWEFSANKHAANSFLVRPPLLGVNEKKGVFATRSPFRPNHLGLSSVRIEKIEWDSNRGPLIHVLGADLMEGTPIYDIKPYVSLADCHPEARCGFVDTHQLKRLKVEYADYVTEKLTKSQQETLKKILELDPRPHYHDDASKVYGMYYGNYNVRFKVDGLLLTVIDCELTDSKVNP